MTLITDIDLLHWEPNIMIDASAAAQPLLNGSGSLDRTVFTIASGSLIDAHVSAGHVIVLSGTIAGSFPVVSVTNATTLVLSTLYDDLESAQSAAPPGSGSGLNFAIRTFWPQRRTMTDLVLQAARIKSADVTKILNPDVLRRPCTLGTLHMIYSGLASGSDKPSDMLARADLYERLYRRSLRSTTLELDLDGDGVIDERRSLNILDMRRV